MKTKLLLVCITLLSTQVNAEMVRGGWESEDSSEVMIDTSTGLEWLTLKATQGLSINDILEDDRFDGWRVANQSEVESLIANGLPRLDSSGENVSYNNLSYSTSVHATWSDIRTFSYWLGETKKTHQWGHSSGFYFNDALSELLYTRFDYIRNGKITYNYHDDIKLTNNRVDDFKSNDFGVYLVSDGGNSFLSQSNPALNANNPNAPSDVPTPLFFGLISFASVLLLKKKPQL